jgi:hypothetical protein
VVFPGIRILADTIPENAKSIYLKSNRAKNEYPIWGTSFKNLYKNN